MHEQQKNAHFFKYGKAHDHNAWKNIDFFFRECQRRNKKNDEIDEIKKYKNGKFDEYKKKKTSALTMMQKAKVWPLSCYDFTFFDAFFSLPSRIAFREKYWISRLLFASPENRYITFYLSARVEINVRVFFFLYPNNECTKR